MGRSWRGSCPHDDSRRVLVLVGEAEREGREARRVGQLRRPAVQAQLGRRPGAHDLDVGPWDRRVAVGRQDLHRRLLGREAGREAQRIAAAVLALGGGVDPLQVALAVLGERAGDGAGLHEVDPDAQRHARSLEWRPMTAAVHLERWSAPDLPLLTALNGDPEQMAHVGGAESAEKIAERQARYAADPNQLRIVDDASGQGVGWVGFWLRSWRGEEVYEIGWSVLPAFQGRGIASTATALAVAAAREARAAPYVHAFPGVDNAASNAVCRRVGFELVEPALSFEYPPGTMMVVNDWRLAL